MTPDQIKTASGYATAEPEKRAMIEATIAQSTQPLDEKNIYQMIASGVGVPMNIKSTPAYKMADLQYNKAKQYATLSAPQLVDAIRNGEIIE